MREKAEEMEDKTYIEGKKLHHFIIKPDGKLYWIANMPQYESGCNGEPICCPAGKCATETEYQQTLQSAKDNAIEVLNWNKVGQWINERRDGHRSVFESLDEGRIYSLECEVEIKDEYHKKFPEVLVKEVALITLSENNKKQKIDSVQWQDIMTTAAGTEPEVKEETQDELWSEVISNCDGAMCTPHVFEECCKYLKSKYQITRRNP